MMEIISGIIKKIKYYMNNSYKIKAKLLQPIYKNFLIPIKVKKVRKKSIINVLFVINELGSWKTENLYMEMKKHPRFNPQLLLLPELSADYAYGIVKDYLEKKNYKYEVIKENETIKKRFHPDIIFYQKPYGGVIADKLFYYNNLSSLFCYVVYCFRNRNRPELNKVDFLKYIWQLYTENSKVTEERTNLLRKGGKILVNTGLSFMDDLLIDKSFYIDPWKPLEGHKKRIIYAPHHTLYSDIYTYATFLDYCDFMLEMVKKYQKEVQWAFKPHPLLKSKLYSIWGKEKTDDYYYKWATYEGAQIAEGEYMGLFKHSDAMIHDCGSYKLEYLYTNNPVMYLVKPDQEYDYPNWQTQEALKLHYKGRGKKDIENFIIDVIKGDDPLKEGRSFFVKNYLTPPNGKTACENIINAILGREEYAE